MAFIVKNKPVDYAALETGTYPARLVGIAGVGEQTVNYDGRASSRDQIVLMFEAIGLHRRHKDGNPYTITVDGKEVPEPQTVRMEISRSLAANSNLIKVISKLMQIPEDPEEIDIEQALNAPCLLSVEKKLAASGSEYNKVDTVSQPIMGMNIDLPRTKPFCYDVESHTDEAFNTLPEWIQEMVKKSTQWADMHANSTPVATAPPNLAVVAGQTINTQTGEVVAPAQPVMQPMAAPVIAQPVMQPMAAPVIAQPMTGTAQKAPF